MAWRAAAIASLAATAAAEKCNEHGGMFKELDALGRRAGTEQLKPSATCDHAISQQWLYRVKSFVSTRAVAVFGVERSAGLEAVHNRMLAAGACWDFWDMWQAEVAAYLHCTYPDAGGSRPADTYVFVGGKFAGTGTAFAGEQVAETALVATLQGASVQFECGSPDRCQHLASKEEIERAEALRRSKPVVLFGWDGCPCTRTAEHRLHEAGACFHVELWNTYRAPLLRYYQCVYGMDDHSFVWIGHRHVGTGFALDKRRMSQPTLMAELADAGATVECVTPLRHEREVAAAHPACPAATVGDFPDCEKCDNDQHCAGHAKSVAPDPTHARCACECAAGWQGFDCSEAVLTRPPTQAETRDPTEAAVTKQPVGNKIVTVALGAEQAAATVSASDDAGAVQQAVAEGERMVRGAGEHAEVEEPMKPTDENAKRKHPCMLMASAFAVALLTVTACIVRSCRRCRQRKAAAKKEAVLGVVVGEDGKVRPTEKLVEVVEGRRVSGSDGPSTPGASQELASTPSSQDSAKKTPYEASLPSEPAMAD